MLEPNRRDSPQGIAAHVNAGIGYRADIDGLRTVAVVPVVLFHAGIPLFSGGFVGVDNFFVISGYLITGILLASIRNNTFSIARFYERRIKRIFPALVIVLAASSAAALVFLTPERLVDFGESMAATSVFGSNFYFWKSVDYFSTNAHVQPLLHTWSLAVEEQFYIFYPFLLYIVARTRLPLHWILLAGGAISLTAAAALLYAMPGAVFYLLPFRAWELVVGGLLATGFPAAPAGQRTIAVSGIAGAALIVCPIVFYSTDTPFPGLAALPPVLGAALLIWSGSASSSPIHRLLSTRPFVLVGRASYSFYLWHFPLFAFAAYLLNRPLDLATGALLSLAALAMALATLFLVEDPVRRSRSAAAWAVPLVLMVAVGTGSFVLARSDGLPERLPPRARAIIDVAADKNRHPVQCMSSGNNVVSEPCLLGAPGKAPSVLLWGDSHALVTATAMETAAREAGSAFLFLATADCPPGLGFSISPEYQPSLSTGAAYRSCADYNQRMLDLSRSPSVRKVVISARWSNWRIGEPPNPVEDPADLRLADSNGPASSSADNARIFEEGFRRLLSALRAEGKEVYVVGPLPEPAFDVPQTLFVARYGLVSPPDALTFADFQKRHRKALEILGRSGAHMLWPHRILCRDAECALTIDGLPAYLDHNHLSVEAARRTAGLYDEVFDRRIER